MGTSFDYSTVSHQTIYSGITGGPGSVGLTDASQGWGDIADTLGDFRAQMEQAVLGMGAAQQGREADAATQAIMALFPWLDDCISTALQTATQIAAQASLFTYTRDNMPPPRVLPETSFFDQSPEWLPGIQTEQERDLVGGQQDEQRARELMSRYQDASNENLALRPYFATAPTVVLDVADPSASGGGLGGGHAAGAPPATTAAALVSGLVSRFGAGVDQAQTPAPVPTVPQVAGGYLSPGEQLMTGPDAVQPAAAAPLGLAAPFGPGAAGSGASRGNRLRGGSRFAGAGERNHDGSFGPRPAAAVDPAAGKFPLHGAPLQERTQQASAGWAPALLGATGGGGRGGHSGERHRPRYLIEQDTNALVGALPPVVPPVIGADEDH